MSSIQHDTMKQFVIEILVNRIVVQLDKEKSDRSR
jgi:hypothetical protein